MDVAAAFSRQANAFYGKALCVMLLALSLGACAVSSKSPTPSASAKPPQQASAEYDSAGRDIIGSSAENAAPINVSSRILIAPDAGAFGLELVEGEDFNQLVIAPSQKLSGTGSISSEVARLESPPRLVVDLFGISGAQGQSFNTADSALVSRVRIGAHPGKIRVVLDLVEGFPIEHRVDQGSASGSGDFTITLAKQGEVDRVYAQLRNSSAPAHGGSADGVSQAAYNQGWSEQEPASEAQFDTSGESFAAGTESGGATTVVGLALKQVSPEENMLVAQLSSPAEYSLTRTAPSEYVLTLKDAGLVETARTALIAPRGAGAIRSVRPVEESGKVSLRVFTAPNVVLRAQESADRIALIQDRAAKFPEDSRAQVSPEAVEKAAEGAAKPVEAASTSNGTEEELDKSLEALLGKQQRWTGRLISLDLQDTDIDNALRIIAEVSNLNIIASEDVTGKVTLRLIDVPWDQALDVILKTNGLDKVQEGNVVRIAPVEKLRVEREQLKLAKQAEQELEDLVVSYIRISYAKASELKDLVENVLTERGSVAYDERTNQLIVKDIESGIANVARLVEKLDLRTPQVLIETQIVEASRSFLRKLGSSLGYTNVQSPATGNATGNNFPNSVVSSASTDYGGAAFTSVLDIVLESADATKSLTAALSAEEEEGRVRVISRPAVATTNNRAAQIKSVEKIRVKTPSGGVNVATGSGASSGGGSSVATETIEIGITLEVTPQASPDYFVLLDIDAKSSTFGDRVVEGIPSEVERSATSSILVSSGQTFALGGIYKINELDNNTGTPWLKDVPVFGTFFRGTNLDHGDEELLFFLTPRIIEGSFDDAAMKAAL